MYKAVFFVMACLLATSSVEAGEASAGDPQCVGSTDPNGDGVFTIVPPGECDFYYECDSMGNLMDTIYCCGRKVIDEACSLIDC